MTSRKRECYTDQPPAWANWGPGKEPKQIRDAYDKTTSKDTPTDGRRTK